VKRLILILAAAVAIAWLWRHRPAPAANPAAAPEPSAASSDSGGAGLTLAQAAQEAADAGSTGSVHENMSPDDVRRLLGPPDSVQTSTAPDGSAQERWIYGRQHRAVVFKNGVAVSVEPD
jgi:hypothetical protein